MLNVFESILDFLVMIKDYVLNLVQGIASLTDMIVQGFGVLSYTASYMPSALLAFVMAGLSICVVFHIIGR